MQIRDHGELQFVMWKPGAQRELGIVNGKRMRLPPSCDADSAAQQDAETQPAEQPGSRAGGPQRKKQQLAGLLDALLHTWEIPINEEEYQFYNTEE